MEMTSLLLATSMLQGSATPNFQIGAGSPPELSWLTLIGKTKTEIYNLHRSGKLQCKDIRGENVLRDDYSLDYEVDIIRVRDREGALPRPDNYKYLRIGATLTFDAPKDSPGGKVSEISVNSVNSYHSSQHTQGEGYTFPVRALLRHIFLSGPLLAYRVTHSAFERELAFNTNLNNRIGTVKTMVEYPYLWTIFAPIGAGHVMEVKLSTSGPWWATSTYDPETRSNKLSVSQYSPARNPFLDSSIESVSIFRRGGRLKDLNFEDSSDPNWIETMRESRERGEVRFPGREREPFVLTASFLKGWRDMFDKNSVRIDRVVSASRPKALQGLDSNPASKPDSSPAILAANWLVILATEGSSTQAQSAKRKLEKTVGGIKVAATTEFKLLKPGLWIAYLGPFPNREATQSVVKMLKTKRVDHYVKRGK